MSLTKEFQEAIEKAAPIFDVDDRYLKTTAEVCAELCERKVIEGKIEVLKNMVQYCRGGSTIFVDTYNSDFIKGHSKALTLAAEVIELEISSLESQIKTNNNGN